MGNEGRHYKLPTNDCIPFVVDKVKRRGFGFLTRLKEKMKDKKDKVSKSEHTILGTEGMFQ